MAEIIELESLAGTHITAACKEAADKAKSTGCPVHFVFNGTHVTAQPGETSDELVARWTADYEAAAKAYREDPQREVERREREAEYKAACEAHMTESAQAEKDMRDATVPTPLTKEQLTEYIESLVNRSHDYGTCVYAMSMAATAAFNYVASKLGVTGFQASCADMDILTRTRRIKGPWMILKGEDALYPQYDLPGKLAEALEKWKPWLKEQAAKMLDEKHEYAHPNVIAHWKRLADQ